MQPSLHSFPPKAKHVIFLFMAGAPCHGLKTQLGNLRLDNKQSALRVITPNDSATSLLVQRITGTKDQPRMPMGGKPLTPGEIATLRSWIDAGAKWLDAASQKTAKHWAFIPPVRPAVPADGRRSSPISKDF